ncbi:autophagy protein (Atg22), putative [Metarhizium acridum CQMa 102]|uniref:Autophagy-related protein n=1 Tax=Metarhizium acridum (strain CQMa 102) TaxID=655827 RepID=E9EF23_METAQ|nr:autophagy protein (Atg22), putative [Metarhizium acridum CQMa 102]EFY85468.1 autophagy protein (Atg22), putative [Metarhizium acridum CQMa 102]
MPSETDTKEAREVNHQSLAVQEENPASVAPAPTNEQREVVTPALGEGDIPTTSQWEIRSWYLYYIGANGLALFNFGPTAFQNLLDQAAGDSGLLYFAGRARDVNSIVLLANGMSFAIQAALFLVIGALADFGTGGRDAGAGRGRHTHDEPVGDPLMNLLDQAAGDSGLLYFAGRARDVNSIVLLANGMSFAIQAALFLVIGAYADFGTGRRWVLLVWSVIAYGIGFGWLGVHDAARWKVAAGLYIIGLVAYQLTLTYWTAAFPSLARNTAHLKASRVAYETGEITQQELDRRDEMERSRLSNVAFWIQSCGEIAILAVIVGIMFGLRVDDSPSNNNWGLSVLVAFATACWLALSIPWFVLEKKRPGMRIPPGRNIVTVGLWQLYEALTQIWRLKQSLVYLAGYFLLGDSLNTTVTVIATLQNQVVSYNTLTLTYLLIVGVGTQALGIGGFWLIQKSFNLSAKTMFNAVMVFIVLLDGWGMVGNWTDRFGFKNVWEVWLYQAYYGLVVCPWYSYSQIMISSVTPRGHEFLFFSVFNIIGKASSFIGPLISSAIIDATPGGQNNSAPFYFLFALSLLSALGIWAFLDLDKSAREQEDFLVQEKERVYGEDTAAGKEKLAAV